MIQELDQKIADVQKTITEAKEELKSLRRQQKEALKNSYKSQIQKIVGQEVNIKIGKINSYTNKCEQGQFVISSKKPLKDGSSTFASFDLVTMPGCCGIVISTNSYINHHYRNRGLGTLLNKIRLAIAYEWGYSLILCTDVIDNKPQGKILSKNDWQKLTQFKNARTCNDVALHEHTLCHDSTPFGFDVNYGCGSGTK